MRNWLKLIISSVAAISLLAVTSSSYGVASFARQTGLECVSCHASAGFPSLNSFGAAFKAGGYTQLGGQLPVVEGDGLSLPGALNLGVVFKARIQTILPETGPSITSMEIPDETAVFAAGRVAEDIGFVIELGDAWFNSFKLVFAPTVGPVKVGIVTWFTDAFGAGWAFETLSTGAVRNIRVAEDRNLVSAQSATGWGGGGEAAGVGLYIWHPVGFVAYTPFSPLHVLDVGQMGHYFRVALTPSFDIADVGLGFAMKTGAETGWLAYEPDGYWDGLGAPAYIAPVWEEYNWMAVDLQVMFTDFPLTFIVTYAADSIADESVMTFVLDYLVMDSPANPLGVTFAYRLGLTNIDSQVGGSIKFGLAQNVRLSVDVHFNLGDSSGVTYTQVLPMVSGSW